MDPQNKEWLQNKLGKIWNLDTYCGICLEENDKLCSMNMEFVISNQKTSKSFLDILNYVFNGDIESLAANMKICEVCTEKALQAYIFIHNTKQLSKIISKSIDNVLSKVVDISEQMDYTFDYKNANIMMVLETEPDFNDIVSDLINTEIVPISTPNVVSNIYSILPETKHNGTIETEIVDVPKNKIKKNSMKVKKPKSNIQIETDGINPSATNSEVEDEKCVKPEIYIKGGNLVIKPMKTGRTPGLMFNTYKCGECTEIFTSYKMYKEHQKVKHNKQVYQCNLCNKFYNTVQYLNIHYKTHAKARCKICSLILAEEDLMQHLRDQHASNIQIHACNFCDLVYYSKEALETHFKAIHLMNNTKTQPVTESQCPMCLKNVRVENIKTHKCKYQCSECFVNPCVHHKYLTSYREQVLNHSIQIKCIDCDYVTHRKEYLITHVNREHLDHHPFTCDTCGTQFYAKMSLRIHIDQYHSPLNICEYCDLEFTKISLLQNHVNYCKNICRPFACVHCIASFDTLKKLHNHKSLRHNEGGIPCNKCQRRFLTEVDLNQHVVAVHSSIQCKKRRKLIECTLCDIKFKSVKELIEHENMHGANVKYPCKVCAKEFYSLKKLYVHKQRHYDRIQCKGCKKRIVTAFYPQHAVRCPYSDSQKSLGHMCEVCGKVFHLKSLLTMHFNVHKERVACPDCGKMLKPPGLKKHMEIYHHKPSSETYLSILRSNNVFQCNICEYKGARKCNLEAHINRYHLKIKPYVCSICKKDFCGKVRLKEHMATHLTENKCYCSVCGKKFANRVCLKMHNRMHTGETPYTCDICGEKFRTSSIMKTHRLKKHLEKTVQCPLCNSMFYLVRDMRYHFKRVHWKDKQAPFNHKEILTEEYYHLFEDGRLPKLDTTNEEPNVIFEIEDIKTDIQLMEEESCNI